MQSSSSMAEQGRFRGEFAKKGFPRFQRDSSCSWEQVFFEYQKAEPQRQKRLAAEHDLFAALATTLTALCGEPQPPTPLRWAGYARTSGAFAIGPPDPRSGKNKKRLSTRARLLVPAHLHFPSRDLTAAAAVTFF